MMALQGTLVYDCTLVHLLILVCPLVISSILMSDMLFPKR